MCIRDRSRQYEDVIARVRSTYEGGELSVDEDFTDVHGFRTVRLAWSPPPRPRPEGASDEEWERLNAFLRSQRAAMLGEQFDDAAKTRGALVFDPGGQLIAINPLGGG